MTSNDSADDFPAVFPTAVPEVPADLWARVLEHAVDPATQALPGLVPDDDLASSWADDGQDGGDGGAAVLADPGVGDGAEPTHAGEPGQDHHLDHHGHLDLDDLDQDDVRPLADPGQDAGPTWHDLGAGDHHEPGDAW